MKVIYTFIILFFALFLYSCQEQSTSNDPVTPTDSTNKVLNDNSNWKVIATFRTDNTSPQRMMNYSLTDCGLSLDNNNNLNGIIKLESIAIPNSFNTYYLFNISESQSTKTVKQKTDGWYDWKKYYYKPNSSELLESWYYNKIVGATYLYENTHPFINTYNTGVPTIDENGNVLTYGTLKGNGSVIFNFVRYAGSQTDSLFFTGSTSYITSGFYSSIMNNKNCYQISKALKKIWLTKNNSKGYDNSGYGYLDEVKSIPVTNMQNEVTTKFIAQTSKDRRYIYYWVVEEYNSPSNGWLFKFDVQSETFEKVLDNIPLVKSSFANDNGKSNLATISDDGSLFIAGVDNPNASKPVAKIYKISSSDGAVSEYKSSNLLSSANYKISYIKYLNGKLYFGVQSGLLQNEKPQFDIITEK